MEPEQLSIWPEEELNIFAPRKKTKREMRKEEKELLNKKLLERYVLHEEEKEKYNLPLKKEELIKVMNNYNNLCKEKFLQGNQGMGDLIYYHSSIFNPGIPQMILTSLSQYSAKKQEELDISDLKIMYKSLYSILEDESIKGDNFRKFRKANSLTFFGYKQFLIMDEFFKR